MSYSEYSGESEIHRGSRLFNDSVAWDSDVPNLETVASEINGIESLALSYSGSHSYSGPGFDAESISSSPATMGDFNTPFGNGIGNAFASSSLAVTFSSEESVGNQVFFNVIYDFFIVDPVNQFNKSIELGARLSDENGIIDEFLLSFDENSQEFSGRPKEELLSAFLTFDGVNDQTLFVETFAFADSGVLPTPLPAAGWMFISAIAGLVGLRYKSKK